MATTDGNVVQVDQSLIGEGIVRLRKYGSQDPLIDIGNCDTFNLGFSVEKRELKNFRGGGGNRNVKEIIGAITAALGLYDLTAGNIARALQGNTVAVDATAVTDELLVCGGIINEFVPFANIPNLSEAVTVTDAAASPETLTAGTDYVLNPHGLTILSEKITAAGVKVSYTPKAGSAIHLLAGSGQEWEIHIAGLNDAQSGAPYAVRIHRAKFGLTSEFALLSQDYTKLSPPLEILADDTVTGTGISKFVRMDIVD